MTIAADLSNFAFSAAGVNTGGFTMRNKIINGAMVIDQRNGGASVSPVDTAYTLDRWQVKQNAGVKFSVQQNAGSVTPPDGYKNYIGCTSLSAYSVGASDIYSFRQCIEGYNVVDLAWGTASAAAVTLSFWVRSSLTGIFGASIFNYNGTRSYPFSYTISSANTWEQKTITIAGDTSGTWGTDNTTGTFVSFSLGSGSSRSGTAGSWVGSYVTSVTGATSVVGTNGATFYITGVQLEKGTSATPFEYRNYQQELAMCQRYYCKTFDIGTAPGNNVSTAGAFMLGNSASNYEPSVTWRFPVEMRTAPSITLYNPETGTAGQWSAGGGSTSSNARSLFIGSSSAVLDNTDVTLGGSNGWRIHAAASAEL